jgi:AraC family L-rhamnose operon transcriptional activator RhaR
MDIWDRKKYMGVDEPFYLNKFFERCTLDIHSHEVIEIEYVLSGKGMHYVAEEEIPVVAGDVFLTQCGVPHCFLSQKEEEPLQVINILFAPETMHNSGFKIEEFLSVVSSVLYNFVFYKENNSVPYFMIKDEGRRIRDICLMMFDEYEGNDEGRRSMMYGYLCQLFVWFMRLYKKQNEDFRNEKGSQKEYIDKVLDYVKNNYTKEISLSDIARIALLSPNYFCEVFKKATGKNVSGYIQELRIDKACELLKSPNDTIESVAEKTGYHDVGTFRRAFKKVVGKSPREYRAEL